ncbi:MAG TPA: hypothetical protein VHD83_28870 [Puia sp.]|nr:hypothetical protein [Puia sp.]
MKLPLLLSQFLYQTKKLDLPGIGSFSLDPSAVIPEAGDRHMQTPASGITFKNASIHTPDDALIQFIKDHTGKMKPLAAADLDFFLTTGKQLLNIGKPFYLEGIGTLIKNNEGKFDFTPGEYTPVRLEEVAAEKKQLATQSFEEPPRDYEPPSNNIRQGVLLFGIVAGLILIGWGGYYLYKKNTYVEPTAETRPAVTVPDSVPPPTDTTRTPSQDPAAQTAATQQAATQPAQTQPADTKSVATPTQQPTANIVSTSPDASLYKFVILETERKGRALRRYNQLLGFQLNIKMNQKDSSYFKLYFPIMATIRDTTRIKDSLADVYAAHVTIEH